MTMRLTQSVRGICFHWCGFVTLDFRYGTTITSQTQSDFLYFPFFVCDGDGDGYADDDDDGLGENQEDLGKLHHSSSGHEG